MSFNTIAIDGFSSCGKSTLAKALARHLGFLHIDSGAMYRAVTLYFLENQININDKLRLNKAMEDIYIEFDSLGDQTIILLNGDDITSEIRKMYISEKVSDISRLRHVRAILQHQQRRIATGRNIIMDGRDIGTAVFPNAKIKFFITADPMIRAKRRHKELLSRGEHCTLAEVYINLTTRDNNDTNREEDPLICAKDAIIIDNTSLTQREQLEYAINTIRTSSIVTKY